MLGLHPGLVWTEYPKGETPPAWNHLHPIIPRDGSDFLSEFRATGWIHSTDKNWWRRMVGFVLAELGDLLLQARLYEIVRAVQYGLP